MSDYNEKDGWVCLTPEPLPLGTHIGYESIGGSFRIYYKRDSDLLIEGTFPVVADDFTRTDPKDTFGGVF